MWKRRERAAPFFKQHVPYNPFLGQTERLTVPEGLPTYVAMMQIKEEDTHDNYVVCRGFWPEQQKFFDILSVAKPYGVRGTKPYAIGEVYAAALAVTRIGITPGVSETSTGHPADLDEVIGILTDDAGVVIQWILLDAGAANVVGVTLTEDMGAITSGEASCTIYPTWDPVAETYNGSLTNQICKDTRSIYTLAESGAAGLAIRRLGNGREVYEALVLYKEITVVTNWQVSGTNIQIKTRTVRVLASGDESSWTTVHTGTTCS